MKTKFSTLTETKKKEITKKIKELDESINGGIDALRRYKELMQMIRDNVDEFKKELSEIRKKYNFDD